MKRARQGDMKIDRAARGGWAYLVDAGPGDPGLLTQRAARLLASADVVLHDGLVAEAVLAGVRRDAAVERLATEAADFVHGPQGATSRVGTAVATHLRAGRSVVRLLGGDAFGTARLVREVRCLRRAGAAFELVAGVSAMAAATCCAALAPEVDRLAGSGTTTTLPVQGTLALHALTTPAATLWLRLSGRSLAETCSALLGQAGRSPDELACAVEALATPRQRLATAPLGALASAAAAAGVTRPELLVVGATVALRDELRWFDTRPLFGKRVLVTRAEHQADETLALLRGRGAEAISFPAIAIEPPPDRERVSQAVRELGDYDLVAFTSENAVHHLFEELDRQERDARAFGAARVAAIGPGTARALGERGLRPDIVGAQFVAESLASAILAAFGDGSAPRPRRALLPRALVAREVLPETLAQAGFVVDVVPVYQTVQAPAERREALHAALAAREVDVVLFTSTSTVTQLLAILGEDAPKLLARTRLASIGPITTRALRERGLDPFVTATTSTLPGLVDALEAALG